MLNPAVENGPRHHAFSKKSSQSAALVRRVHGPLQPRPTGLFFARIHYSHLRTDKRISQNGSDQAGKAMSRDGLVVVIFFALATALAMGFLAVALSFPELMPWYSEPSPRG